MMHATPRIECGDHVHDLGILRLGASENIKLWAAVIGTVISIGTTIGGLAVAMSRFEHRATIQESNTQVLVSRADSLERGLEKVTDKVSQSEGDRREMKAQLEMAVGTIDRIERKLDRNPLSSRAIPPD